MLPATVFKCMSGKQFVCYRQKNYIIGFPENEYATVWIKTLGSDVLLAEEQRPQVVKVADQKII